MSRAKSLSLICDDCGKQMQPFTLPGAHNCDGGEALRKAAHELFAPTVDLIERTIAKAGTGVLRGVFEVAAERDRLRNSHEKLAELVGGAILLLNGDCPLTETNCDEWLARARVAMVQP